MSHTTKKILTCAATVLVSTLFLAHAQAQTAPDQNQVAKIMKTANDMEIKAAKVAKSKAQNAEVKAFAEEMIKAHEENNKEAKKITKTNDINPKSSDGSKSLEKEAESKVSDMKKMKGLDFDKAYIDSQVNMHEQLLTDLDTKFIPAATNVNFKTFLETTKSHVQEHLAKAKTIQATLTK
jgi:putative membrane protein